MAGRTGEKVGWIGGWLGGFIWILILCIVFLIQGKQTEGLIGLLLLLLGVLLVLVCAPWKHPTTCYWKLMLPIYALLIVSFLWALQSSGGAEKLGLGWWSLSWFLPLLIPFGTVGRRRWSDFEAQLPVAAIAPGHAPW